MKTIAFLGLCMLLAKNVHTQTTTLPNGCTVGRTSDLPHFIEDFFELKAPYLNCSQLGLSEYDFVGVPNDIVSICLTHNDLTTVKLDDFANFTKLERLMLGHNKISRIVTLTSGSMPSVQHVSLANNHFAKVPSALWKSFPALLDVDISDNGISVIADGDFEGAGQLLSIFMEYNPLAEISSTAMRPVSSSLLLLGLSFCRLTEVPAFLANASKLEILNLASNKITQIPSDAFRGSKSLQRLVLANNEIQWLDPLAFSGADQLQFIDLADNLLESLPAGVFDVMAEETSMSISLYENPLRCNCTLRWLKEREKSIAFSEIGYKCAQPKRNHGKKSYSIKLADFSCDPDDEDWTESCSSDGGKQTAPASKPETITPVKESTLCPKACKCFDSKGQQYYPHSGNNASADTRPAIKFWWRKIVHYPFVDCTNAGLKKLPAGVRPDAKTLSLAGNNISTINIKDLKPLQSLEFLNLESCQLINIVPDLTAKFRRLTTLLVHHNNLTKFGKDHLKSFPIVTILRMHGNKIDDFPRDMFSNNQNLSLLFLGPNPAKNFDSKCLDGLELSFLSLRNLSLTSIPQLRSTNLFRLEMSDNKITTIPNNSFVQTPKLTRLSLDNNLIATIAPHAFRSASSLLFLDLSENKLTTLPRGVFDDLNEDRLQVELWMNRMNCDCKLKWLKEWIDRLETENPLTEIRFMCFRPFRIHGKISDTLKPNDFTCESGDERPKPDENDEEAEEEYFDFEHGKCYTGGHIALTVFLTVFCTFLCYLFVRWCCARRKAYARYKSPTDALQLNMEMEST